MDASHEHTSESRNSSRPAAGHRPWQESEVFCIHSYAGEAGPACGWHGLKRETRRDEKSGARRCPRCGRATVMEIRKGC